MENILQYYHQQIHNYLYMIDKYISVYLKHHNYIFHNYFYMKNSVLHYLLYNIFFHLILNYLLKHILNDYYLKLYKIQRIHYKNYFLGIFYS